MDGPRFVVRQEVHHAGLSRQRQFPDFIEKQRSAFGGFEQTAAGAAHAVAVAEQFLFDQRLRYGGTVDGDQRRPAAAAAGVQRPGDQFLARSEFSGDQDRSARGGDLADPDLEIAHGIARTDHGELFSAAGDGV